MNTLLAAGFLALLGTSPISLQNTPPQEAVERVPVPSKADQARIRKEIQALFKEEYARRDVESRADLARQMVQQAEETVGR